MTHPREMIRLPPAALAFLALVEPLIGPTVFLTSFVEKGSMVPKVFNIKPKQNLTLENKGRKKEKSKCLSDLQSGTKQFYFSLD